MKRGEIMLRNELLSGVMRYAVRISYLRYVYILYGIG